MLTAFFVLLDDLDIDFHIKKCKGKIIGNGSTTYDDAVLDLIGLEADLAEKACCIQRGSQDGNHITVVDDVITAGNGYIVRTLDSADKDIAAESVGNLRYTHSVKLKFRKNLEFKKLYTATCKGVDLDC